MGDLHITVVGGEWDRIVGVIKKYPAEKIIFLTSIREDTKKQADKLSKFTSSLIDTEIIPISYSRLNKLIYQLKEIIEKNIKNYDNIYVNISGGTRIVAIAFVILSQYYPLRIIYAIPKMYTPGGKYKTKGVEEILKLPVLNLGNITKLSKPEREALSFLSKEPISFSKFIEDYARKNKVLLNDIRMRDLKSRFSYTFRRLKEKNVIDAEIKDRNLLISLTDTGEFLMNIG